MNHSQAIFKALADQGKNLADDVRFKRDLIRELERIRQWIAVNGGGK